MKKYILILLLIGQLSNAQYNLFARQNFNYKTVSTSTNTEIGGVASTISTPALLAYKLAIDVSRISNFTIAGSDIKCKITGSYTVIGFDFNGTPCTYYTDSDYLVTALGYWAFYSTYNFQGKDVDFQNCLTVDTSALSRVYANRFLLKNVTSIANNCFWQSPIATVFYIPNCTSLGSTVGDNAVFTDINPLAKIYCNPSLATSNSGAPDGDLAYAISRGATVRYVTNFTAPSPITNLSSGTVYNTAIQLNFTPPSTTNAIDYYECYVNGVFKNTITTSGQYITGLTPSTNYDITLKAVDIFYNKSVVSNILSTSTTNRSAVDVDAIAYITASSNSTYQDIIDDLFTSLKSNSLYTKTQAFYPFIGTTAAQHKWNAKNPNDSDAAFRLTFTGAATFSNNGYQLNGSSYANTYFIPSAQQALNSNGMTIVCGTNNTPVGDCVDMGSFISTTQKSYIIARGASNKSIAGFNSVNAESSATSQAKGIFTGTKQSSTVTDLFINGTQIATVAGAGTLPTVSCYIGALNLNGSVYGNSNQRIQMAIIHEGLSDAEVVILHTIIDTFETALGRKTW